MAPLDQTPDSPTSRAFELLERDEPLAALVQALQFARRHGRLAAISGEAGIGKTSLIEEFIRRERSKADIFRGGCDALRTPSPLGPLIDIAAELGGQTASCLEASASRQLLFPAFVDDLSHRSRPTAVIFEDVHWADEATLDLLKFAGRRIDRTRALIVVTWRDDEIDLEHPIRRVLGEWRHDATLRIQLRPLSLAAVTKLAGGTRNAEALYALTGGNPFFVTEVLGSSNDPVPVTVRDAVLARRASLGADARAVVDFVSIVPSRAELRLVEAALNPSANAVDACMAAGLLKASDHALMFRHELARLAVGGALPPPRARYYHRLVLDALLAQPERSAVLARIVHHAEACGAVEAVLEYVPAAARQAAALGAHRQAVEHYCRALEHRDALDDEAKARLFSDYAYELHMTGDMAARSAQREALMLWRRLGEPLAIGRSVRWLSRLAWFAGDRADAEACANEAIEVLRTLPGTYELAMAYSNRSQLDMLVRNVDGCVEWGVKAMGLARALGATDVLCHALNNIGTARADIADIEKSLTLALANDLHEHAARAYTNLASTEISRRHYANARKWLEEGLVYTAERDLDAFGSYLQAWRARLHAETGQWTQACEDAEAVLAHSRAAATTSRISAFSALGLVHVRRGDPDTDRILDEALALARPTREPQRLLPVLIARAELAFLTGRRAEAPEWVREALQEHVTSNEREWLTYLQWKTGMLPPGVTEVNGPCGLLIRGDWQASAARWAEIGCPYEEALALIEGDVAAATRALEIFLTLGAMPAAGLARQRLRGLGASRVPRGRRGTTLAHPAGLTTRESEVLEMLACGLANPDIADRLFVSRKTIEHHVSSILAKLDVHTREAAVTRARREGWV